MNEYVFKSQKYELLKCKKRVQLHGEVFTPQNIVDLMLEQEDIKRCCTNLTSTFLEPAAGEGAFLIEILNRKLSMVGNKYNSSITQYENHSLLALSTIYGIELLDDNTEICVMNLFEVFINHYNKQLDSFKAEKKSNVLKSAKLIISKNIVQGNFLTRTTVTKMPIVFSEWKPRSLRKGQKRIRIDRTEYSLEEIAKRVKKENGRLYSNDDHTIQMNLFTWNDETKEKKVGYKYSPTFIDNVFKEEVEEIYES